MRNPFVGILALLCGFASQTASALDVTGAWIGTGNIVADDSNGTRQGVCEDVRMDVAHGEGYLHLNRMTWRCDYYWSTFQPLRLDVRGEGLWIGDEQVGTISGRTVDVTVSDLSNRLEWIHAELLEDGTIRFRHHKFFDAGHWKRTIDHEAVLIRTP